MNVKIENLTRPTWAEIDLAATEHNVRCIRNIVGPKVGVMAVVKANAYGHGLPAVALAAERAGACMLGFASLGEAMSLNGQLSIPRMVLGWTPGWLAEVAVQHEIVSAVFDMEIAGEFARAAQQIGKPAHIHVKIDTGMGRLGFMPDEAAPAIEQMALMQGLSLDGIFTHFSKADEADASYTRQQIGKFKQVLSELEARGISIPMKHAANSPGLLRFPEAHFDLVRPGILLHGLDPSDDAPAPGDFRPALSLKTMVAFVKTLPPGSAVSYGGTYVTQGEERIAVLPIGYADGFRRAPHNWGEVLVRGRRAPIGGRVCMDQVMINVTHIPEVERGDEVVLIGSQGDYRLRAEDVAAKLGTNNYEVICMLMARVPRMYRA